MARYFWHVSCISDIASWLFNETCHVNHYWSIYIYSPAARCDEGNTRLAAGFPE
jgi:hypothetical protein